MSNEITNKQKTLKPGISNIVIAALIFIPASLLVYYTLYCGTTSVTHSSSIIALVLMVLAKLYAMTYLLSYFFTRGSFNDEGISFYSIWRGQRDEKWDNLVELAYDKDETYYVLKFENGTKIRISILIKGHPDLLKFLEDKGDEFWDQ